MRAGTKARLQEQGKGTESGPRYEASVPLYSRKLHIRVRRASTSWVTSLMILAFSLGDRVVNHFANLWKYVRI